MLLKSLPYLNFILIIGSILAYIFYQNNHTIVFVENAEVFEKFKMSKDLKLLANKELDTKRIHIDSLYNKLSSIHDEYAQKLVMRQILTDKENLDYFQNEFAAEQTPKVWARIKNYSKEYADLKGYTIILGSQPNANILFGTDSKNVTKEFINYINSKYEGNK